MRSYLIGALLGCALGMAVVAGSEGLADWLDGANAYGTGLPVLRTEPASGFGQAAGIPFAETAGAVRAPLPSTLRGQIRS